ncbi:MAG: hydroxymethylglutaryl-CoA reductase, degradative [Thermoprotei archaeon]|nr:MAG: hydroxymethylglutaryl-CoA reductase, degradative [Thermoprotei archaeon]RLE90017.1 MAG: hydroxymethylglutaryl-CoA reductase, degradative [Thermoprotei archaeon]
MRTSRIPGFYKLPIEERLRKVVEFASLHEDDIELLRKWGNLEPKIADIMIENVIGTMSYPLAVAVNFLINKRDYMVPMVIEEPSVVAAASHAAKLTRESGGIDAIATDSIMIGQVQVVKVHDPAYKRILVLEHRDQILEIANEKDPILVKLGGGAKDLEVKIIESPLGPMLVVYLLVDVKDAMGANAVNTMCEAIAPYIQELTGGRVYLRIVSNLADRRIVRARTKVKKDVLGGEEVVEGILYAWAFAAADPYRAATHNKGIMNGVVAVARATAQDCRALEAGAHAYAAKGGVYRPLSIWEKDENGDLVGSLEMPMPVGIVGGATKVHPVARVSLKILGVKTARELAEVMGAVGLAQNLAALKALATEGIQKGHMRLHARNLAIMAGAPRDLVDKIAESMIREGNISYARAKELVEEFTYKS